MEVEEHVPLAPLTTFGVGGAARYFTRVRTRDELVDALAYAREKSLPVLLLGGGSNVLVGEKGFDGLVVKIELVGVELEEEDARNVLLIAGAGECWDALVARAVSEGLWGLENLSGIPGTVGGAAHGNIGAYGQAISQTLTWAEVYDAQDGTVRKMTNEACELGYRDSALKRAHGRYIILRAAFSLSKEGKPELSYKDLAARFGSEPDVSLKDIRAAVLEIRKGKFPDLSVEGTAGSFFKNPILPEQEAQALKERYPEMPLFSMPETSGVKIPLAWLLDHALGLKGLRIGSARLFEKQPLVLVIDRKGSASDGVALQSLVREKVRDALNIEVEPEVHIIA